MTIRATDPTAIKRVYPHVDELTDWRTAATVRLLWDRIHDLEARLQASEATTIDLVSGHNTNEMSITVVGQDARAALALSQTMAGSAAGGGATGGGASGGTGGTGPGGGIELPGGGDGGAGATGCAAAGATGHDTGGLLTAVRAGQIICGTGNEWSALKNPVATLAERSANNVELLRRMIWHLQQAGFTAGRQQNPSGAISEQKLCVIVDGVLRAYEVLDGVPIDQPIPTLMEETAPPVLVSDAGISD